MANDNIVAVHPFHDAGREATGAELMHANPYRPWPARITSITELTPTEKLFEFRFVDERIREAFRQEPGQFVELSIFGVGEAPISISSSPTKSGFIELCVRRTGRFTERLHQMQCGEIVGIRGPFGRGFPIDKMRGHDVLLVAGGLGIAPLRSLINNIHDERSEFGKVTIIYGSKNPSEVMFRNQFEMWKHRRDFELHLTVDNADEGWDGEVGLVTKPFEHLEIDPSNTFGALCGPPVMYRFVVQEMRKKDCLLYTSLVGSCVPSKRQWGYRNKLELSCGADGAGRLILGMRPEGGADVVSLDACPLAHRNIEGAPKALRGALRYLSGGSDLGLFRVGVRGSLRTRDVEIALWTTPGPFPRAAAAKTLASALKNTSVVRVMADPGRARKVKKVEAISGKGCWEEEVAESRLLLSAPSFAQVNTAQAEKLVELVLAGLEVEAGDYVADLYAGAGTFTLPLARAGAEVVAVESAGSSVRDLRRNAERAGADIDIIGGDAARELPELGELDALVVDPPRAGLADGVVASIAAASPRRVAYVSCDASTWARDAARFEREGYRLIRVTPVDLFPQTYHVEVVSIFERSGS